jgi:hypothetical protein
LKTLSDDAIFSRCGSFVIAVFHAARPSATDSFWM